MSQQWPWSKEGQQRPGLGVCTPGMLGFPVWEVWAYWKSCILEHLSYVSRGWKSWGCTAEVILSMPINTSWGRKSEPEYFQWCTLKEAKGTNSVQEIAFKIASDFFLKKFFTVAMTEKWTGCPEMSWRALAKSCFCWPCFKEECWTNQSPEVPAKLHHAVILLQNTALLNPRLMSEMKCLLEPGHLLYFDSILHTEVYDQLWGCTGTGGQCKGMITCRIPTYAGKPAHPASLSEENVKDC